MNSPLDEVNLRTTGLLLLLSFAAALILVGVLLIKTRMWDTRKKDKGSSGSADAGRFLVMAGAILAFVSALFLIINFAGLKP